MDELSNLLRELYKDAYLQGRQDGLEGLHIEPQLVFNNYLTDENVAKKLSLLGDLPTLTLCSSPVDLH
ncbi:hypothetical protein A5320_20645 [Rheinheimera sp. SA_1]|uniref:hypothetical protein n=1 Tax=Rheinheimera sp. SA_1 TaxID=1827365 RepID=UPI0008014F1C|nr:hypothetical protein [Rheinheimera sp. SA_1]OBP17258.1 hypothetical protein A5320_20645 [Rheinheimera sp. SA_1]